MARPTKAKAIERLQKVLDEVPELQELSSHSPQFIKWRRDAQVAIDHTFGDKSSQAKDFLKTVVHVLTNIPQPHSVSGKPVRDSKYQEAHQRGLASLESVLKSMREEVEEYWNEDEQQSSGTSNPQPEMPTNTKKVFVVHGHDESARESVARFLEKLKLEPIILHEQPNEGRTIIEKFEQHADIGFAVVLLTPDDEGRPARHGNGLTPRARQNVILELGFFLGKLGRKCVCPLVKGDVERPSDYDGVVYTRLDEDGGWKTDLIRELKNAGFDVDANLAF